MSSCRTWLGSQRAWPGMPLHREAVHVPLSWGSSAQAVWAVSEPMQTGPKTAQTRVRDPCGRCWRLSWLDVGKVPRVPRP